MDVLDAISYMLLFLAAGPFLDKLFLKQGDTVNRHHQGNRSDDSDGLTLFAETKNSTKFKLEIYNSRANIPCIPEVGAACLILIG